MRHGQSHYLKLEWQGEARRIFVAGFSNGAGIGHAWPGGRPYAPGADRPVPDLSASHLIWAFFEAHPLEAP